MAEISYRRHRFPPVVIQHAVWLYLRFTLELSRCRGTACRTRARHVLRERAQLGAEIRADDCPAAAAGSSSAERSMTSRRDGHPDRGQTDVSMARRRSRRRDPRRLGSAPSRPALPSSSYTSRASRRRGWRRISCAPPALRSSTSGFPDTMSRACDRTIGPENPHQVVRRGFPDQGRNFPDGLI